MDGEKATSHGSTSVNKENSFQLKITSTIPLHFVTKRTRFRLSIVHVIGIQTEPLPKETNPNSPFPSTIYKVETKQDERDSWLTRTRML